MSEDIAKARLVSFNTLPLDRMRGSITRRFVGTENMMLGEIRFKAGDMVPVHSHPNEQITYIISGALRFVFGDDQDQEVVARAGDAVLIDANFPHSAYALEDTLELDFFWPPRADWINGDDAYMRERESTSLSDDRGSG
jgi:quercetin dioxygenase-like cupin family protein